MSEFWNKNIVKKVEVVVAYFRKNWYRATIAEIKKHIKDIYDPDIIFDIKELKNADNILHFTFFGQHICMLFPKWLNDNQKIHINSILDEIFNKQIYKNLFWDKILDIWWYYWESAIYFHATNPDAQIHIYEPQKTCFEYIGKSLKGIPNIYLYNNFVVWNKNESTFWIADNWLCDSKKEPIIWSYNSNFSYPKVVDIETIINNYDPDCIKIDVEWWEYDICKKIIDKPELLKNITNGVVEFHDLWIEINQQNLLNFILKLKILWYSYKYIYSDWRSIGFEQVKKYWIINLYFCK